MGIQTWQAYPGYVTTSELYGISMPTRLTPGVPVTTNNDLPDLSAWHEVPEGATIPAGTVVLRRCEPGSGGSEALDIYCLSAPFIRTKSTYRFYTEEPIRPPMPTEFGSVIRILHTRCGGPSLPMRAVFGGAGRWHVEGGGFLRTTDITDWEPIERSNA